MNVCLNPQKWAQFSQMIDLRGHIPRFTWKNECFPIYLLGNPIHVCWNPQNRSHFSKMIDLMVNCIRLLKNMNVFSSIFLEIQYMCVETLRTGLVYPRWSILGSYTLVYSNNKFSHLSPWKCHKGVFKPSEQGSFFQDNWFEGHIPRFTLKMNLFPSFFLETP